MVTLVVSMLAMLPSLPSTQNAMALNPEANQPATLTTMAYADNLSGGSQTTEPKAMALPPRENLASAHEALEDNRLPLLVGGFSILTVLACLGILAINRMRRR
jgi:hypothetical protein